MTDHHPVSTAIDIVYKVKSFGFEGLKAFTLRKEQQQCLTTLDEDDTEEEVLLRCASACWMGQDYFRMWLGDENITYPQLTMTHLNQLYHLTNGVYYFEFNGDESHFWVWIIQDNELCYAGTYGGVCDIVVTNFNKWHYFDRFIRAMQGSLYDYEYVFQLFEAAVEDVNYENLVYYKSDKYI